MTINQEKVRKTELLMIGLGGICCVMLDILLYHVCCGRYICARYTNHVLIHNLHVMWYSVYVWSRVCIFAHL